MPAPLPPPKPWQRNTGGHLTAARTKSMIIESFVAHNWRKRKYTNVTFKPGTNLIQGGSNTGKTSTFKGMATCLALYPGSRVGPSDIHDAANEADLTLTILLPRATAGDAVEIEGQVPEYDRHKIRRVIRRKGANEVWIDDEKVDIAKAFETITVTWGLPHPEQLIGMLWQPQMEIHMLVREKPGARRTRYHDLLGYHPIEALSKRLDAIVKRLNDDVAKQREMYTLNPAETESTIAALRESLDQIAKRVAEFPAVALLQRRITALNRWIAKARSLELEEKAETAANAVPAEIRPLAESHRQAILQKNGGTAPSLGAIESLAQIKSSVASIEAELAAIKATVDDVVPASSAEAALKHFIAAAAAEESQRVVDMSILRLPEAYRNWAREYRTHLASTSNLDDREKGRARQNGTVATAAVMIERNSLAREAIKVNERIELAKNALSMVLGENAPTAEDRALLRLHSKKAGEMQALLTELGLSGPIPSAELRKAMRAFQVAKLASALPALESPLPGRANASWKPSAKAEEALATIWAEIDSVQDASPVTRCPLTGDDIDKRRMHEAREAAKKRRELALASTAWRTFIQKAEPVSKNVAQFATEGNFAKVYDCIHIANTIVSTFLSDHNAHRTDAFWTRGAEVETLCKLMDEVVNLDSSLAGARKWLSDTAATLGMTGVELLDRVDCLSKQLNDLGPVRVIEGEPFSDEVAGQLREVNRLLLAEDTALATLATVIKPTFNGVEWPVPQSTDEAAARLNTLREVAPKRVKLRTSLDAAQARQQTLEATFGEFAGIALALADKLVANASACGSLAFPAATHHAFNNALAAFRNEAQTIDARSFEWPTDAGDEPTTVTIAEARARAEQASITEIATLQGQRTANEASLRRAEQSLAEIKDRAAKMKTQEETIARFDTLRQFLDKDNGPKVLMSQEFLDIVNRANGVLSQISVPISLVGDEDFELYELDSRKPNIEPLARETGGAYGNILGIALAIGLVEHFNATTQGTPINTMFVDEPTICVEKETIPALLETLSNKGRRIGQQSIIIEHEPMTSSYADHRILFEAEKDDVQTSLAA